MMFENFRLKHSQIKYMLKCHRRLGLLWCGASRREQWRNRVQARRLSHGSGKLSITLLRSNFRELHGTIKSV